MSICLPLFPHLQTLGYFSHIPSCHFPSSLTISYLMIYIWMGHSTQGKQKEKVHSEALSCSLEPPCTVLLQGWGPFLGLYLQSCIHPQPSPNGHSCPILQMSKLTPRALKVLVQGLHLESSGVGGKPRHLGLAALLTTP